MTTLKPKLKYTTNTNTTKIQQKYLYKRNCKSIQMTLLAAWQFTVLYDTPRGIELRVLTETHHH